MPITVGVDSYIDVTGADEYFNNRLFTDAWANATETDKEKALKQATRKIDMMPLKGIPVSTDQPLAFPRAYFAPSQPESERRFDLSPGWWAMDDVPDAVKWAVCEEALAMLEYGNSKRFKLQAQGVKNVSFGDMSEVYGPNNPYGFLSLDAYRLMKQYLAGSVLIT